MDSCSVGIICSELCHKHSYGPVSTKIKDIEGAYNETTQRLLRLRVGSDVSSVCEYHEKKILIKYNHLFGQTCCDPLKTHKKFISKGLREILIEHLDMPKNHTVNLNPGKSLCPNCYAKIFIVKENMDVDEEQYANCTYIPPEETLNQLDSACSALGVSPISKIRKISTDKRNTIIDAKIKKISNKLRRNLEGCFNQPATAEDDGQDEQTVLNEEHTKLIESLKEKCKVSTTEENVKKN